MDEKKNLINKKQRNYGIDLLRIFSMINIINLHINRYSYLLSIFDFSSPKYKHIWRLEIFSYPAVDNFGLISGIVGYKKYKFSNLIYLWIKSSFYSIFLTIYSIFIHKKKIKKKIIILSLFPILIKRNWYINAYFSMYLLIPIINNGIILLNKNIHRNLIISFIFFYNVYYIISIILGLYSISELLNNGYSSMWLIILYIIGAYIGKYKISKKKKITRVYIFSYLLMYLFSFLYTSEITFKLIEFKSTITKIFINYISPTIIMQSISLIMILSKIDIKNKLLIKIISFLSPLTFSALLIHEILFREKSNKIKILFNWIIDFKNEMLFYKIYGTGVIIYLICVFIDYIRLIIFKLLRIRDFCLFLERIIPDLTEKIILFLN